VQPADRGASAEAERVRSGAVRISERARSLRPGGRGGV
jgi:hypothetical protein